MNLMGDKVILRRIGEQDEGMLRCLTDDPETVKVTGGYPRIPSWEHQINWFRSFSGAGGDVRGVIADKEHPETGLGIIILSHVDPVERTGEVYIKLVRPARGKGYGQDAVAALVSYGFSGLGLNRIRARILKDNQASRKLFEKCGFKEESVCRGTGLSDGENRNVCVYGICRRDGWEESRTFWQ